MNKPGAKNHEILQLQQSVDNNIMRYLREKEGGDWPPPRIESTYSDFPEPLDRFLQSVDVMTMFGAYYFILGPLISFMVVSGDLTKEKELRLRQGLTVVGVS